MNKKERLRFLVIFGVCLVFAGFIIISLVKVRYSVQGEEKNELDIMELTLTDSIERGEDGNLAVRSFLPPDSGETGKEEPVKGKVKPCPT